MFMIWNCVVK